MKRALLLAAGKATRLGALRDQYAKACVPVGGTTPLIRLIEQLTAAGVDELIVNLHWQQDQVRAQALDAAPRGVRVHFVEEPSLLGTGGTLLVATQQLGVLPDLIVNAKLFTDLDWSALRACEAGTLVLHPASPLTTFGGLRHTEGETPQLLGLLPAAEATADHQPDAAVYTGIARPDAHWLPRLEAAQAGLAPGEVLCLARAGFLAAAAAGERVPVWRHPGAWCEISTPERVAAAEALARALVS